MSGFFGVASKKRTAYWNFFTEWIIILIWGTRRGGMAVYGEHGFDRAITTLKTHLSVQNLTGMWVHEGKYGNRMYF